MVLVNMVLLWYYLQQYLVDVFLYPFECYSVDVVLRKSRWTTSNVFARFQRQLVCWNGVVYSRGRIHLNLFVVCTATISNECWLNGFEHASMTMDVSQFLEYNREEFGH